MEEEVEIVEYAEEVPEHCRDHISLGLWANPVLKVSSILEC